MTDWQAFLPDIVPDVDGCPEPTVMLALSRASRQFFEQTRLWRMWLAPVTISAGVLNYPLVLDTNADLVGLERATLNDRAIRVLSGAAMPSDWRIQTTTQITPCVFTEDRITFNFLPAQITGDVVQIEVTLKPSHGATGIGDTFFAQYAESLAMGAKARLMLQPGKPYSNPNLGALLEQQFNNAITDINIRRARGFSASSLTVSPRRFSAPR